MMRGFQIWPQIQMEKIFDPHFSQKPMENGQNPDLAHFRHFSAINPRRGGTRREVFSSFPLVYFTPPVNFLSQGQVRSPD